MPTYQDIYPSNPLLRSTDLLRPRAADLMTVEYFEAEPASMPTEVFSQHHILINVRPGAMRLENWRDGAHRDFLFSENEISVTPAGTKSGWRWHVRSKCVVATIDPARLRRFAECEIGVLLMPRQFADREQCEDADLAQAARQLVGAMQERGPGFELMYESLARVFLIKLIQRHGLARSPALEYCDRFTAAHYKRVLDYVSEHFGGPISVERLAHEAGMSASHFSRLFRQVIGDTPYRFLLRYRVEQAARMLADRSRAMSDIALACGFNDQPHLSRTFKAFTGETPRTYRTRQ